MRPDIVNLRQFYSSRLGRKVKARLGVLARAYWPWREGEFIVGFGYAPPMLQLLAHRQKQTTPVVALMPISQGAMYWPVHASNQSILADEMRPPFAPNSLQRVVMLHALEYVTAPDELLRVVWQLLAPGGRLLLVVPNRRGLWASMGATPFALGTSYTLAKLKELLYEAEFTLRETSAALFVPPSTHPFWIRSWGVLEWMGTLCFPRWGGVHIVEAEKQIYAGILQPHVKPRRNRKWVTQQGMARTG